MTKLVTFLSAMMLVACGVQAQQSIESRLESLTPSDPIAYFRLAEDVAASSGTADEQQLARRLYAIAFALTSDESKTDDSEFPIAASACLGLADLERSTSRKRWLLALAGRLDPRYATRSWDASEQSSPSSEAALLLAEGIGLRSRAMAPLHVNASMIRELPLSSKKPRESSTGQARAHPPHSFSAKRRSGPAPSAATPARCPIAPKAGRSDVSAQRAEAIRAR